MSEIIKLWCGWGWSLSRPEYLDTFEALSAEKIFNERVLDAGLTAHWRVGTAQVFGEPSEARLQEKLFRWREEAILAMIGEEDAKKNSRSL